MGNTADLDAMKSQHENQSLEGSMNEERVCDEWVFHNRASKVATCKAELKVGRNKATVLHLRPVGDIFPQNILNERRRSKLV